MIDKIDYDFTLAEGDSAVGPYYGAGIIVVTIIGIVLSVIGRMESGKIENTGIKMAFIFVGIVIFLLGLFVWKVAKRFIWADIY